MENELIAMTDTNISIAREPSIVLEEAHRAARALSNVIAGKSNPVMFNGEQYLEFEDWQTVARFYSLAVKTGHAEPVDVDGIKGAKASAEIIDVRTGNVLGGAEAYCLRDEKNWASKPWAQLASMAQTRSGAKACRNVLSWVVVLAGYKATPAEEMEEVFVPKESKAVQNAIPVVTSNLPLSMQGEPTPQIMVAEIKDWLGLLNGGDSARMETELMRLTKYTNKEGKESFVRIEDLVGISQRRPAWIKTIHSKVEQEYNRKQVK